MKAFLHFERALAGEHRSRTEHDAEVGILPPPRKRAKTDAGRGGKRFTGAFVPDETHAALKALARGDCRTLSGYLRRLYAREIERQAGAILKPAAKPPGAGWYWWRQRAGQQWRALQVKDDHGTLYADSADNREHQSDDDSAHPWRGEWWPVEITPPA